LKSGVDDIGNRTRVRVIKNKVAPPFREAEFDILFSEGISKTGDILDIGTSIGVIDKRGAFFRYGETSLGQGREAAKAFLAANPALADQIEAAIRAQHGLAAETTS
jgi:recombination protein RecA